MAESRHFFSRLINGLASYVRRQVGLQGRTDRQRQNNAFPWHDWWQQHNATSTGHGWNDWGQRQGASSLSWLTVWLLTCNGESACAGRLIDGGNTMLFLGMIDGGNTTLLLAGVDGLINSGDTALLLLAGQRFGYLRATASQRAWADWLMAATWCFFLGKINGGDTTLLHLAGWWWEGMLATCLVWQTKFWCTQK